MTVMGSDNTKRIDIYVNEAVYDALHHATVNGDIDSGASLITSFIADYTDDPEAVRSNHHAIQGDERIPVDLDHHLHRQFKIQCADHGVSMNAVVRSNLADWFESYSDSVNADA